MLPYECKAVKDIVYLAMQENELANKAAELYKKMLEVSSKTEENLQTIKSVKSIKDEDGDMLGAYKRSILNDYTSPLSPEQFDAAFEDGLEEAKRKRGINDIDFKPAEFDISNFPNLAEEIPDINDTILK